MDRRLKDIEGMSVVFHIEEFVFLTESPFMSESPFRSFTVCGREDL